VKDERIHELLIEYMGCMDEHNCVKGRYGNGICYL